MISSASLIDSYAKDLELRGIAPGTRRTYLIILQHFASKQSDLLHVGKAELKAYLAYLRLERGCRAATLELQFSVLSSFYEYLVDEELMAANPLPAFRKRNLRQYKKETNPKKIISVEEAAHFVGGIVDSRDKALILLLLKTGMRRHELAELDISDVNLSRQELQLKPTPKRSNRTIFFDGETQEALEWWLQSRSKMITRSEALFIGTGGLRLKPDRITRIVEEHATRAGLHDPRSKQSVDRLTAHCCRHWFTTHLIRAGMPRDFIKELRGDSRREAIDIYNHIDKEELRRSYLASIPQLGI